MIILFRCKGYQNYEVFRILMLLIGNEYEECDVQLDLIFPEKREKIFYYLLDVLREH